MKKINTCLNPILQKICQQAIEFEGLSKRIHACLPQEYHEHCKVGSFQKGRLTLIADHPAWGAELRYLLPQLRDDLRAKEHLYQLVSIHLIIKP